MKVVFILIWPGPKIRGLRVSLDKPVWKNQVIFGQFIFKDQQVGFLRRDSLEIKHNIKEVLGSSCGFD